MYLFGVIHDLEYFDEEVTHIERIVNPAGKVVLLELAPNYENNIGTFFDPNFFCRLADRYRLVGSDVILGDQKLTIPKEYCPLRFRLLGEEYFYPNNCRDKIIRARIRKREPDIVIVGNGHSDEIKEHFQCADYTLFVPAGARRDRFRRSDSVWCQPQRVITVGK